MFCRLERAYDITNSSHVQNQNKHLVGMPELVFNGILDMQGVCQSSGLANRDGPATKGVVSSMV